jgi:hypothetical protein
MDDVCDDITDWGRAFFTRSIPTVKLGKQVRAFIAAVDLPVIPRSTESIDLPTARPSLWRRCLGFVRGVAVAMYKIFREVADSCSCMPLSR